MCRSAASRWLTTAVTLLVVLSVPAAAWAQSASRVAAGSDIEVSNATECAPNADVSLFFEADGTEPRRIGIGVSDPSGHFAVRVPVPDEVEGPAAITVVCGLNAAVLSYEIDVFEESSGILGSAWPVLAVLGAVVVVVALVIVLRRRTPAPAGVMAVRPEDAGADAQQGSDAADGEHAAPAEQGDDEDDDAEYWFWETRTEAGPRRRIACVTPTTFHLHEVAAEEFQAMLDRFVSDGAETTLADSFVRIPLGEIDVVRHRGTAVQIDHRSPSGSRTHTIDLGSELQAVLDMLRPHVRVVDVDSAEPAKA